MYLSQVSIEPELRSAFRRNCLAVFSVEYCRDWEIRTFGDAGPVAPSPSPWSTLPPWVLPIALIGGAGLLAMTLMRR